MNTGARRVAVSCLEFEGKQVCLFYDLMEERIVDDLTDFTIELSHGAKQLGPTTIADASRGLARFWEFQRGRGNDLANCTDQQLECFRDAELKSVLSSPTAMKSLRIAQRTVNVRVRFVYQLLNWLQASGRIPRNSIGPHGCPVRSTLPLYEESSDDIRRRSSERNRYPLTFRQTGSQSKHATKFVPSEAHRYAAIQSLHEQASADFFAHRNALLIDIANSVGWRRASINSLTVTQVREALVATRSHDYATITPATQKFGYVEAFDVPAWLIERMEHYIREYLLPTATSRGWKWRPGSDYLFIGARGMRLTDRAITQIIAKAMRAAGAPRWVAIHSFRRKFSNDEIADETAHRIKNDLDTSAASIAASVSIRLGHHDPSSLYAYVSRRLSIGRNEVDEQRLAHLTTIEQENIELKARLRGMDQTRESDEP